MSDLLSDSVDPCSPGRALAQTIARALAEGKAAAQRELSDNEFAAVFLAYTDAFQALEAGRQTDALEELEQTVFRDADPSQTCVALCALALGNALALPQHGPVDLQLAAHVALGRRKVFNALAHGTQALVLSALGDSGIFEAQREPGISGQDRELARYVQCWCLGLGDALALPQHGPVDLQQVAQAALQWHEVFSGLGHHVQIVVLLTLVNGGINQARREAGAAGQDRALARYIQCWSLGLGDALALPQHGPVDLKQAAQAALERREAFIALRPGVHDPVLRALLQGAYTHTERDPRPPGQDRALARYVQCWSLCLGDALTLPPGGLVDFQQAAQAALERRGVFSALAPGTQSEVLTALVKSAFTQAQREPGRLGQDRKLARYVQCWSLGLGDALALPEHGPVDLQQAAQAALFRREVFSTLAPDAQAQVLRALVNGGTAQYQRKPGQQGQDRALARYAQCWSLGLGNALALPQHGPVDLQQAAQLALQRREVFTALAPDAQESVLRALVYGGITQGQREPGLPGQYRGLARCAQCWSLGLGDALVMPQHGPVDLQQAALAALQRREVFGALAPDVQEQVLKALDSGGVFQALCEPGVLGQDRALGRYAQCWSLGLGDALALPQHGPIDLQRAAQAAQDRRETFSALAPGAQEEVFLSLFNGRFAWRSGTGKLILWIVQMALLPRVQQAVAQSSQWSGENAPSAHYNPRSPVAAATWLLRASALPVMPQHAQQVVATVELTSQLLALGRREQAPLSQWLTQPAGEQLAAELSRLACKQRDWPLQFTELPHWLAALGLATAELGVPAPELSSHWRPDVAALAERCAWLRCLDADGSARRSHILMPASLPVAGAFSLDASRWQLDDSDHSRWASWLATLAKGEPLGDIEHAFTAWWHQMHGSAEAMFHWRQGMLPGEPTQTAWQASAQAALMAQADRFVQQVWHLASHGLPTEPQAVALHWPDAASAGTLANLRLSSLNQAHAGDTDRLLQAQQYWAGHLIAQSEDAAQLWRLLELSRHSLLPAKPGSLQWHDWDKTALDALVAAERRALNDAQARLDAQERGLREPPNCLNADRPVEPFATMAQQWERMGVGLEVPSTRAVAQCLTSHEALIQPWWDAEGRGHVLLLRPNQTVQRVSMPAQLDAPHWQRLDQAWQGAARLDAQGDCDDFDLDQAFAQAWQAMAAPGGVAVATWHWLREQVGPECTQLIVVWPADKAAWPWQALAESIEPEDGGAVMELAVSAAALLKSRTPVSTPVSSPGSTAPHSQESTHAALFVDDLWRSPQTAHQTATRIEASALPYALRQQARRSADAASYLQALRCNGMVHLAAHGVYDSGQPLASHLVLHDAAAMRREAQDSERARRRARRRFVGPVDADAAQATTDAATSSEQVLTEQRHALPAWLLAQMRLNQLEVSLSACQALRVGVGEDETTALRGPAGLGAVLSAAGARTVVGSLWTCDSLAIALFYERWFHHRQQSDALRSLRRARQDLRSMSWQDYEQWTVRWLRQACDDGLLDEAAHAELQRQALEQLHQKQASIWFKGRNSGPFDHPIDWGGMCLIGNAPPRSDAQWLPPRDATPVATRWWQRLLQRLGIIASTARTA